jgi:hypothetical protein
VTKKGRASKKHKAQRARAKAKERAAKLGKSCVLCGESDRHLRRFRVIVDKQRHADWATCRSCCAVLVVLLADSRNHKR